MNFFRTALYNVMYEALLLTKKQDNSVPLGVGRMRITRCVLEQSVFEFTDAFFRGLKYLKLTTTGHAQT